MKRALNNTIILRLKEGIYKNIFLYVVNDSDLSLEIRLSSKAVIYYKKSKILTLHSKKTEPTLLSEGYYVNLSKPNLDLENPKAYFAIAKQLVDNHSDTKKNIEFTIQQNIAYYNRDCKNEFVVIDMEYQFAQQYVENRTQKKTRFDLVAYNHQKNEIVLLELKYGFASSTGNSGVDDHIKKFLEHVKNAQFKTALISDIKTILEQKIELGIIDVALNKKISKIQDAQIRFMVVFAYDKAPDKVAYNNKFGKMNDILFIDHSNHQYILKSNG